MKLSKKNGKNNEKRSYFIKTSLTAFNILLIYLFFILKDFSTNPKYKAINKKLKENNFFREANENCDKFDPIFLMKERFKRKPFTICQNKESKHICYLNSKFSKYSKIYKSKHGIICIFENVILDPLKSNQTD